MMQNEKDFLADAERWDNRELGADAAHVEVATPEEHERVMQGIRTSVRPIDSNRMFGLTRNAQELADFESDLNGRPLQRYAYPSAPRRVKPGRSRKAMQKASRRRNRK